MKKKLLYTVAIIIGICWIVASLLPDYTLLFNI